MDLQQMRYVVEVAATSSFTRAAERCFVTQSALSHQIAALERDLGERLFVRSSRSTRVTEAGEAFLVHARAALASADEARQAVRGDSAPLEGTVRVGIIPTVSAIRVPHLLAAFRAEHPAVRVELQMGNSDDLAARVRRGDLDLALLGLRPGAELPGLGHRRLAVDRHALMVAASHPLAGRTRVRLRDLEDEVFADFPTGSSGRAQTDVAFDAAGIRRDVAFEVDSADVLRDIVSEGLAIALLTPGAIVHTSDAVRTVDVVDGPSRVEYVVWDRAAPRRVARALLTVLERAASD